VFFRFCSWLSHIPVVVELHESEIVFPIVQVVHVLGLVLMVGTVVLVDLRLLGVLLPREPAQEICGPLLKLSWVGFAVLVVSGLLLFAAQAESMYGNTFFRLKFLLLAISGLNVATFHATTYRRVGEWGASGTTPRHAKVAAGVSLVLWTGVMSASHFIPYYGGL
jgi:uncharacterized protein DUF6644